MSTSSVSNNGNLSPELIYYLRIRNLEDKGDCLPSGFCNTGRGVIYYPAKILDLSTTFPSLFKPFDFDERRLSFPLVTSSHYFPNVRYGYQDTFGFEKRFNGYISKLSQVAELIKRLPKSNDAGDLTEFRRNVGFFVTPILNLNGDLRGIKELITQMHRSASEDGFLPQTMIGDKLPNYYHSFIRKGLNTFEIPLYIVNTGLQTSFNSISVELGDLLRTLLPRAIMTALKERGISADVTYFKRTNCAISGPPRELIEPILNRAASILGERLYYNWVEVMGRDPGLLPDSLKGREYLKFNPFFSVGYSMLSKSHVESVMRTKGWSRPGELNRVVSVEGYLKLIEAGANAGKAEDNRRTCNGEKKVVIYDGSFLPQYLKEGIVPLLVAPTNVQFSNNKKGKAYVLSLSPGSCSSDLSNIETLREAMYRAFSQGQLIRPDHTSGRPLPVPDVLKDIIVKIRSSYRKFLGNQSEGNLIELLSNIRRLSEFETRADIKKINSTSGLISALKESYRLSQEQLQFTGWLKQGNFEESVLNLIKKRGKNQKTFLLAFEANMFRPYGQINTGLSDPGMTNLAAVIHESFKRSAAKRLNLSTIEFAAGKTGDEFTIFFNGDKSIGHEKMKMVIADVQKSVKQRFGRQSYDSQKKIKLISAGNEPLTLRLKVYYENGNKYYSFMRPLIGIEYVENPTITAQIKDNKEKMRAYYPKGTEPDSLGRVIFIPQTSMSSVIIDNPPNPVKTTLSVTGAGLVIENIPSVTSKGQIDKVREEAFAQVEKAKENKKQRLVSDGMLKMGITDLTSNPYYGNVVRILAPAALNIPSQRLMRALVNWDLERANETPLQNDVMNMVMIGVGNRFGANVYSKFMTRKNPHLVPNLSNRGARLTGLGFGLLSLQTFHGHFDPLRLSIDLMYMETAHGFANGARSVLTKFAPFKFLQTGAGMILFNVLAESFGLEWLYKIEGDIFRYLSSSSTKSAAAKSLSTIGGLMKGDGMKFVRHYEEYLASRKNGLHKKDGFLRYLMDVIRNNFTNLAVLRSLKFSKKFMRMLDLEAKRHKSMVDQATSICQKIKYYQLMNVGFGVLPSMSDKWWVILQNVMGSERLDFANINVDLLHDRLLSKFSGEYMHRVNMLKLNERRAQMTQTDSYQQLLKKYFVSLKKIGKVIPNYSSVELMRRKELRRQFLPRIIKAAFALSSWSHNMAEAMLMNPKKLLEIEKSRLEQIKNDLIHNLADGDRAKVIAAYGEALNLAQRRSVKAYQDKLIDYLYATPLYQLNSNFAFVLKAVEKVLPSMNSFIIQEVSRRYVRGIVMHRIFNTNFGWLTGLVY